MTDNANLALWNKVSRVPKEHLKAFDNGKFKGTAIKPMWSIKTMTEHFGPFGKGWGVASHKFTLLPGESETMVYCEIEVWYGDKDCRVPGIGGDWAVRNNKGQDEAFKKAYTDALTNALKHLGVAADIHMGLWDGNKYVDEKPEPVAMPAANGTPGASKAANRGEYDRLVREIRNANGKAELEKIYRANITEIDALPPDFLDELRVEYNDRLSELKQKAAA